jgi:hypothetical protein
VYDLAQYGFKQKIILQHNRAVGLVMQHPIDALLHSAVHSHNQAA